jgi:hypothetical protein
MKNLSLLLSIIFLLFGFFSTSISSQVINTELNTLVENADIILTGKVSEKNSYWNNHKTRIYTDVVIRTDENLKGNYTGETIRIVTAGGEVGEIGEIYSHSPRFRDKEEVLLFIKKDNKNNSYKILEGENGKISLIENKITGEKVTSSNKKITALKKEIKDYVNKKTQQN